MAVCWLHRSLLVIKRHKENCGSQNPYSAVMNTTLGVVFLTDEIHQQSNNSAADSVEFKLLPILFTNQKTTIFFSFGAI